MSGPIAVVDGTINEDGTLEVRDRVALPAGKVQVTLVPVPELPPGDPFWRLMRGIWAGQKARGHTPRGAEDVEAGLRAAREEWDERMSRITCIQEEAQRLRTQGRPG